MQWPYKHIFEVLRVQYKILTGENFDEFPLSQVLY